MYNAMGETLQCLHPTSGELLWDTKAGDVEDLGGSMFAPPSVVAGKAYVCTATGELRCYDALKGDLLWTHDLGDATRFQPAVADGRVYVGTTGGRLLCIDTGAPSADGWLMWGGGPAHNGPVG